MAYITAEYIAWVNMWQRCRNKKRHDYPRYGGRGISVCNRWIEYDNFLADMGKKPNKEMSLDRINNNGNYEPSNCRWATKSQQRINRRPVLHTHCRRGHPLVPGNIYTQRNGQRQCLTCRHMHGL